MKELKKLWSKDVLMAEGMIITILVTLMLIHLYSGVKLPKM